MRIIVACSTLLGSLACGGDATLAQSRSALEAWDDAAAATSAADRQLALERALAIDPTSPALRRSLARLLAEKQQYPEAERLLTEVIPVEHAAEHIPLLWDRATIRAAAGRESEAAEDLVRCAALGVDPRALGADPAFAVMASKTEYAALLPAVQVVVRESRPAEKVLSGEIWRHTLQVHGPPGPLTLEPVGPIPESLQLVGVVEDELAADAYAVVRELRLEWQASGTGAVHLPGMQALVGRGSGTLAPRRLEVVAVGGDVGSTPPAPSALVVPSSHDSDADDGTARRLAGGWLMGAPAHWACRLNQRPSGTIALTRRHRGQPRWAGFWVPGGTGAEWYCAESDVTASLQ